MTEVIIAVIDDDEATRAALTTLMRAKGFAVCAYDSAEEFLRAETRGAARCIITDIQMPGLSGIELKARLDAENCRTPVIMITARPEKRVQDSAIASGAFCLLRKPFKAHALFDSIERALAL